MNDLISRQAALDIIDSELTGWLTDDERLHLEGVGTGIQCLPTIDPVKRGKWIDNKVAFHLVCSECGCTVRMDKGQVFDRFEDEYNYCPNCGAKNGGEDETD